MANLDFFSNLPNELLHRIVSFLPATTDRARTSLVSRRWRHLWASHPSIDFTLSLPLDPLDVHYADSTYVSAVDACLRSSTAPLLDRLSLDLWLPTSSHCRTADRWLRFAGLRSVRSLWLCSITEPNRSFPRIPRALFSCRAITDLLLFFSTFPPLPPNFPGFPSLKLLYFFSCKVDDLAGLFSVCPLLESISLITCLDLGSIRLDLPNLKHLFLVDSMPVATVEAPNLEVFCFHGDLRQFELKGNPVLRFLRKATIKGNDGMESSSRDDWMKFLVAISGANILTVNDWFYQFVIPESKLFNNLKELNCEIDWVTGSVLHSLIPNLIECPVLEKLSVDLSFKQRSEVKSSIILSNILGLDGDLIPTVEENYENDELDPPEDFLKQGHSLCHLKTVTLREFLGTKNEMFLAKFLLGSAGSLEEFIVFDFLQRDNSRLEEDLQLLFAPIPRASSHVHMKLSR